MSDKKELTIVGRAERIDLLDLSAKKVPAKVDTGADASSIWASSIKIVGDDLQVIFFDPTSEFYTGAIYIFPKSAYSITRVSSSFGHKELRYKVKLRIKMRSRTVRATFTLADRSQKLYPILIGRKLLQGKFLVDVSRGFPLREAEAARAKKLRGELDLLETIE